MGKGRIQAVPTHTTNRFKTLKEIFTRKQVNYTSHVSNWQTPLCKYSNIDVTSAKGKLKACIKMSNTYKPFNPVISLLKINPVGIPAYVHKDIVTEIFLQRRLYQQMNNLCDHPERTGLTENGICFQCFNGSHSKKICSLCVNMEPLPRQSVEKFQDDVKSNLPFLCKQKKEYPHLC